MSLLEYWISPLSSRAVSSLVSSLSFRSWECEVNLGILNFFGIELKDTPALKNCVLWALQSVLRASLDLVWSFILASGRIMQRCSWQLARTCKLLVHCQRGIKTEDCQRPHLWMVPFVSRAWLVGRALSACLRIKEPFSLVFHKSESSD